MKFGKLYSILFLVPSVAFGQTLKQSFPSDLALRIQSCVEKIRAQGEAPKLSKWRIETKPIFHKDGPHYQVPDELVAIFNTLNRKLSRGTPLFSLKANDAMFALSTPSDRTIYVGPVFNIFLETVPVDSRRSLIAFVLGHEMGHYLYDACVEYFPETGKKIEFAGSKINLNPSEVLAINHSVVDALGMYVAEIAGFDLEAIPSFLNYMDEAFNKSDPLGYPIPRVHPYLVLEKTYRNQAIDAYLKSRGELTLPN